MAKRTGAAHVVTIKKTVKGHEYRSDLIRRSYRDGKHVRNETLGNITHLGAEKVEQIRRTLRGDKLLKIDDAVKLSDSRPHGHVSAALSMARALDFERLIDRTTSRKRRLALALVVQRLLAADSKLATSRSLADSTLRDELGLGKVRADDLYAAMDYLLELLVNRFAIDEPARVASRPQSVF